MSEKAKFWTAGKETWGENRSYLVYHYVNVYGEISSPMVTGKRVEEQNGIFLSCFYRQWSIPSEPKRVAQPHRSSQHCWVGKKVQVVKLSLLCQTASSSCAILSCSNKNSLKKVSSLLQCKLEKHSALLRGITNHCVKDRKNESWRLMFKRWKDAYQKWCRH